MEGVPVGLRVDGDRRDAELLACRDDPEGDLAPVGDEDFLEHAARRVAPVPHRAWMPKSFSPNSTGWPFCG